MVYVYFANGFEEIEALTPVDMLRRAGVDVKMIGVNGTKITGAHGIAVECEMLAGDETLDDNLEMIILPGGMPGTLNLEKCGAVKSAIDFCVKNDRYIAAICAAPMILGNLGLLDGKSAVCYPGFEKYLKGAQIPDSRVESSGKIITAVGMGAAAEFSLALVAKLTSAEKSAELKEATLC